jgi:hypothetical protein
MMIGTARVLLTRSPCTVQVAVHSAADAEQCVAKPKTIHSGRPPDRATKMPKGERPTGVVRLFRR